MKTEEVSNKIRNASIICSWMVVMIHVIESGCNYTWVVKYGEKGLFSLAVPFFFMVSGYFLMTHTEERGWWLSALKKRSVTLLIPYFVLSTAYVVMMYGVRELFAPFFKMGPFCLGKIGNIWGITTFPNQPTLGTMWYIRCLVLLVVLSPLMVWVVRKSRMIAFGVLVMLFGWNMVMDYIAGDMKFWRLGLSKLGIFYFYLGLVLRKYYQNLWDVRHKRSMWAVCFMMVGFVLKVPELPWLESFSLPMMLLGFWFAVPMCSFPNWLVSNSFAVYVLHMFVLYVCYAILKALKLVIYAKTILGLVVMGGLVFMLTIGLSILVKRYFPKGASLIFGGR